MDILAVGVFNDIGCGDRMGDTEIKIADDRLRQAKYEVRRNAVVE